MLKKFLLLICLICSFYISSQDRVNRKKLVYEDESGVIFESLGWKYNDFLGEWVSNLNYINKKNNYSMTNSFWASKTDQNFISMSTKTLHFEGEKYYVVIVKSWGGMYKSPSQKKDWTTFERLEGYIFTEEEFNKLKTLDGEVKLSTRIFTSEKVNWLEGDFITYIHNALIKGDTSVDISFYVKKVDEDTVRFLLPTSDSYFTGKYTGVIENDFSKMYFETHTKEFNKLVEFHAYGLKERISKVGMVTDAGTIDDQSYNQATWEGLLQAGDNLGLTVKFLKPVGTSENHYLKEIDNLYDAGYRFIVTPGFKFETTIFKAQDKYSDANFVIIDGTPHSADYAEFRAESNVVSIFFAEHESGFLAGVATALELKDGSVGFIGGMEIPPVQKFNWGFQQGIAYANENLGTMIKLDAENILYQGTFSDVAAGQQLAAQMYDKGVNAIFCAAGGVGVGAINEAKNRAKSGDDAWIVGVDVDQYSEGIYEGEKSVVITSAMKRIDNAAFDMIAAELKSELPGGETLMFNAANDGVGIPAKNPNLSSDVVAKVASVYAKLQAGTIIVAAEQGDLVK